MTKNKTPTRRQANTQQVNQAHLSVQEHYIEGPLPPPVILQQYDTVIPGAAERILAMAEGETTHRRNLESQQLNADMQARVHHIEVERDRIKGIFGSDALGQKLGALVSCMALLAAAITAGMGVAFPPVPLAYWAIPVACVSLPVMGMVQAIAGKRIKPPVGARNATP